MHLVRWSLDMPSVGNMLQEHAAFCSGPHALHVSQLDRSRPPGHLCLSCLALGAHAWPVRSPMRFCVANQAAGHA